MSFGGAKVLSLESRRADEMAELIRINGGDPLVAPSLIEVPIESNGQAFAFADKLYAGDFDMVVFLTGVGARFLGRVLAARDSEERFIDALRNITVVARGPKPVAVLREWKVPIAVTVPEPNTWRELLSAVISRTEKKVALQEYGRPNAQLVTGLEAQGRSVTSVPVYQWQLPQDTTQLAHALDSLLAGHFDVSLFTTGIQVDHFLEFAQAQGEREIAVQALSKTFIASIGPDTTEALQSSGLKPALEPSHPKMGLLVREAALEFARIRN